jgi:flagellar hook-length control protein FliK
MDVVGIALVAPGPAADGPVSDRDARGPDTVFERLFAQGAELPAVSPKVASADAPVPPQNDLPPEGEELLPDLQFAALISGSLTPSDKMSMMARPVPDGQQAAATKSSPSIGLSPAVPFAAGRDPAIATVPDLPGAVPPAVDLVPVPEAESRLSPVPSLPTPSATAGPVQALVATAAAVSMPEKETRYQPLAAAADPTSRVVADAFLQMDTNAGAPQDQPAERSSTQPSHDDPRPALKAAAADTRVADTVVAIMAHPDDSPSVRDPVAVAKDISTARNVAHQIAAEVAPTGSGKTEILLDPAELGRVRLSLQAADHTISIHIHADRTETAELMRRHIDQLIHEFRAIGYQDVRFSFAEQSGQQANHWHGGPSPGDPGPGQGRPDGAVFGSDGQPPPDPERRIPGRPLAGQLDIRL